jgi:hypothetical protein
MLIGDAVVVYSLTFQSPLPADQLERCFVHMLSGNRTKPFSSHFSLTWLSLVSINFNHSKDCLYSIRRHYQSQQSVRYTHSLQRDLLKHMISLSLPLVFGSRSILLPRWSATFFLHVRFTSSIHFLANTILTL